MWRERGVRVCVTLEGGILVRRWFGVFDGLESGPM